MRKIFFLFLGLCIFSTLFFAGCTGKHLIIQKEPVQEPDSTVLAQKDTVETESTDPASCFFFIADSLMQSARSGCEAGEFPQANAALMQVFRHMENMPEFTDEESVNRLGDMYIGIAEIYADLLPKEYLDSLPANIASTIFQYQISRAVDTLLIAPNDSIILSFLKCEAAVPYNIPIVHNDRVHKSLYYIVTARNRVMEMLLSRAGHYLPMMQRLFAENGMPTDLAYLPILESGFNPKAYSYAHASGIWQFIPSTGKIYGLRYDYWLDERRDPVKATVAAIGYLKKLHNDFSDWHLALAAYNCGERRIERALEKAQAKTYWDLTLPKETMYYIPHFIAYQIVGKNPHCFGFYPQTADTFDFDTVQISDCLDLTKIADGINVPYAELKRINPHIRQWCTPPTTENVTLYLPRGVADTFKVFFGTLSDDDKVKWFRYRIKSGDNLLGIAQRHRISVEALKSINKLRNNFIIAGRYLYIPIPANNSYPAAECAPGGGTGGTRKQAAVPEKDRLFDTQGIPPTTYRIQSGETLWHVAEKFNVSIQQICRWNNISKPRYIRSGTTLTLYIKEKKERPRSMLETVDEKRTGSPSGTYVVKEGDNLYSISCKLNIPMERLAAWNNKDIEKPIIHPGEKLFYYCTTGDGESTISKEKAGAQTAKPIAAPGGEAYKADSQKDKTINGSGSDAVHPSGKIIYYTVQRGDNLWKIATHFNVTVDSLFETNNLNQDSVIMPGDTLRIVLPEGS